MSQAIVSAARTGPRYDGIMDVLLSLVSPVTLGFALLIGLVAGFFKGLVGFGIPMLIISGLSLIVAPDLALAGLLLPSLLTNLWQALRFGWRAAWTTIQRYAVFLCVGGVLLVSIAQLVPHINPNLFYMLIGGAMLLFTGLELFGWRMRKPKNPKRAEAVVGAVAGVTGGLAGTWGPPTVLYLTAMDTPKRESILAQGVIYTLGSIALVGAHLNSGILNAQTAVFSGAIVVPTLIGMALGHRIQDRIDQPTFRRLTLIMLMVAGLNLLRRGVMG